MYPLATLLFLLCITALAQPPVRPAGRIYKSTDRGVNWERADKGFPADATVNAWVVKDQKVIAGTNAHGVFISSDRLKTWYPSSKGLPRSARIISMASYKNILFAGTYADGIFFSNDGESWHPSNTGLKNLNIRCFYTHGPVFLAGTDSGIYSSSDGGKSWALEKSGLQINTFLFVNNQIFAATNQGVLASKDYGKTWAWIFKDGAIYTLAANEKEIYLIGLSGIVYKSDINNNFIWLKADLYLPFRYTFQLTPSSPKFLAAEWIGAFKNLNSLNSEFPNNGLPEDAAFTELLDTPFGLLAGAVLPKYN